MKSKTAIYGLLELIENCFPENPYPEKIFTMTFDDFKNEVPDDHLRTRIAGCLSRWQYDTAKEIIMAAIKANVTVCGNVNDYYEVRKQKDGTYNTTCMGRLAFGFETKADALTWCIGVFQDYLIIPD
jgi:hypothetical protein